MISAFGVEDNRLSKVEGSRKHVGATALAAGSVTAGAAGAHAGLAHQGVRSLAASARQADADPHLTGLGDVLRGQLPALKALRLRRLGVAGAGLGVAAGGAALLHDRKKSRS